MLPNGVESSTGVKGLLVCSVTHYYIDVSEKCVEMCGRSGGVWGDDGAIIDETLLIDNSADVTPAREKKRRRLSSCDKKIKRKGTREIKNKKKNRERIGREDYSADVA